MELRASEPEIIEGQPFGNCLLKRSSIGEQLKLFVENTNGGFVLAINNKWGAGKTTFVKMWAQLMVDNGFKTLYLNAWENDFYDDPLIPILGELYEDLKGDDYGNLIEKAGEISASIIPALAKGISKKILGNEDIPELIHDATKGIVQVFKDEVKEYNNKKKSLSEFKKILKKIVDKQCQGKRLIIIIDELDRCRPDYSVDLLEKVKHLFSVDNIIFILSIDKKQLGYAIQGRYGSVNIDTEEYLRRFINYEFTLPAPSTGQFCSALFIKYFGNNGRNPIGKIVNRFNNYSLLDSMTLRQMESFFFILRNCCRSISVNNEYQLLALLFLICVKILYPDLYLKIMNNEFGLNGFHEEITTILRNSLKGDPTVVNNEIVNVEVIFVLCYAGRILKEDAIYNLVNGHDFIKYGLPTYSKIYDQSRFEELIRNYLVKNRIIDYISIIESIGDIAPYG